MTIAILLRAIIVIDLYFLTRQSHEQRVSTNFLEALQALRVGLALSI